MQLNTYILIKHLTGITYKKLRSDPLTCGLSHITLYDTAQPLASDTIYLVESQNLREFSSPGFSYLMVCIGTVPAFLLEDESCDIICCDSTCTITDILRKLQDIFQLYYQWEQEMLQVLLKHDTLTRLCEVTLPIFGNTILLLGPNHEILGTGQEPGKYEISYEYREKDTDFLSAELIQELSSDPLYYETFNYTSPQYYVDVDGIGCLYINVFLDGRYAARIVSDFLYRSMNESDWMAFRIFADYVKKYLELYSITSYDNLTAFKSQLLEYLSTRSFSNQHTLEYSLERIGWCTKDDYLCVVLQPGTHTVLSKSTRHLCNIIENKLPNCITLEVKEQILVICNLKKLQMTGEALNHNITYLVREQIMKAGFSTVFQNLLNIPAFYQQAKAALVIGTAVSATAWIYHFSDYALKYLLNYGIHSLPPEALIPRKLLDLLLYDSGHESDYYLTLRTYLEQNMSATKVTEQLFIHRSTFKYRLKRIEEFLEGETLEHPDTRLYYLTIFRLIDELGPQLLPRCVKE